MSFQAIKKLFLSLLLVGVLCSSACTKIDTNPSPIFHQIQEDVSCLTGHQIYWDSCMDEIVTNTSIEKLIENELTENDVIHIALLNNRNLQGVYENLGIAQAQFSQAGLLKNPIFSLSYRFSTKSNVTDLIDISLLQNFLEILLIPLKRRMAAAELDATKNLVLTQILDVIAEAKIAFYNLKATEQIWNLKKKILLATELSYEVAQKLFEAGNIIDLDMAMNRSVYEQAKLEVASWEVIVLESRERLNILMGLWGQQIDWKLSPYFPELPSEEINFKNIENDAIANSIDLRIAYKGLISTAAGLGVDTSRLVFPQLSIGPSSERDEGVWYVGPAFNLALPLFDFGRVNAAKARAQIAKQWNEYTSLAIDIRSKARSARFFLQNAFRQSQYLKKVIVPLAEEITFHTLLQHNAMQMGVFRLLSAKQNEFEKKIQYIQMQRDYWVSKTEIQILLAGHALGASPFQPPLRKYYE